MIVDAYVTSNEEWLEMEKGRLLVKIQSEFAKLIRTVKAPKSCLNTDSDTCCGLTLGSALAAYLDHLELVPRGGITWHSNVYGVHLLELQRELPQNQESEVKFTCRWETRLTFNTPEDIGTPFSQHVVLTEPAYYTMHCKDPFTRQYHGATRGYSGWFDTLAICVDKQNDPDKVRRVLMKARRSTYLEPTSESSSSDMLLVSVMPSS